MPLVADRCICLRTVEYSETSQVLLLLSREHGLLRVIAKGAHRTTRAGAGRFGGGIDLLEEGDAVFSDRPEKDLLTLTEWRLREGHLPLRRSLRGLYLGFHAAELVCSLFEERDPQPAVFDMLRITLAELATPRVEQAFVAFQLLVLREAGLLPQLQTCRSCGQPVASQGRVSFAPALGGVVCRTCEGAQAQRFVIDGRLLGAVRYMLTLLAGGLTSRLPSLSRAQSDPINRLLAEHVQYVIGRPLRTARFVL